MQPDFTLFRYALLCLLVAGDCEAEGSGSVKERLKAGMKQAHPYAPPPAPVDSSPVLADDAVLQLAPMTVTRNTLRIEDLLAQARRAAEAERARKFSPLKGGLIYAKNLGGTELNLGIWPKLVPLAEIPSLKKGEVMLRVDLLRIRW